LNFGVSPTRLWVIPNQIFEEKRDADRLKFDQSHTRQFHLIVPGRITRAKRPDYMIRIVEQLEARGHSVTVEFIGDARDGYPVDTLINKTSHVRISSWHDDWAKSAKPGSIVVLPSHVEGFGNVLVEAAQQKLISVVGSSSIGPADAVIDGVTGVLVSPDLPEAFADGIEQASLMEFGKLPGWIERFSGGPTQRRLLKLVGLDDRTDAHQGSSI
jgi:glycosyltransferase involved in cell wall biosynthesis